MIAKEKKGYYECNAKVSKDMVIFDKKSNKGCWDSQNLRDIGAIEAGSRDKSLHYNSIELYCADALFSIYI